MSELIVEASSAEHGSTLAELFERAGSPCYCRFWHFEGTSNEWLDRCANDRDRNKDELLTALGEESDEARGIVARAAGSIVGWMKVAPAASMKKAYARRLYKSLPCFDGDRRGVFTIGCFLIDPAHRRRGIASALVAGAVRIAPSWGARALEAFPRVSSESLHDDELWTGPASVFTKHGFTDVSGFAPYPVLRLSL